MDEFHKTRMGHKFFEGDVPRIATALEKIASELDRANTARDLEQDVGKEVPFVEQVWLVYDTRGKGIAQNITVRASEGSARAILSDRIGDITSPDMRNLARQELADWDGQSFATIDRWQVWSEAVNL